MQIGAVAEALGLTTSAIRFYERKGLIRPVGRVAGRREFDAHGVATLRFLKLAQTAGFTLKEAQRLMEFGFGSERPLDDWGDFLKAKRQSVTQKAKELQRMDILLGQFEDCTCSSLEECMTNADCTTQPESAK